MYFVNEYFLFLHFSKRLDFVETDSGFYSQIHFTDLSLEVLFFTAHGPFPSFLPCRNLILFFWGNRHINPLCYGLPPHNLLSYGATQPTTSASMVPQRREQFIVKKEDP
ncbi:hypothetical protein AVEN_59416-1 [Araneus ventricosus]|uniref:Uncharacterized protein n=1 Tax=Araneus ventricosus TaxID=182803 RepID=A0A4Y2KIK7_ARAVE|nr:hypothetical protein AVEN_59416-1 [Araneus ventricosus]